MKFINSAFKTSRTADCIYEKLLALLSLVFHLPISVNRVLDFVKGQFVHVHVGDERALLIKSSAHVTSSVGSRPSFHCCSGPFKIDLGDMSCLVVLRRFTLSHLFQF